LAGMLSKVMSKIAATSLRETEQKIWKLYIIQIVFRLISLPLTYF
jgi:hypothetical protein